MRSAVRLSHLQDMPELYFQRTSAEEQRRHEARLREVAAGGGPFFDPVQDAQGGWNVEIVTRDWEEPGLLDKIFEAILRCIHIPDGVQVRHARIFTGLRQQVVNLLDLQDRHGRPLSRERCEEAIEQLRLIRKGERGALETIQHLPFTSLVPLVTEFPSLDNGRSEQYSYLELAVGRLSNRFTSVLLHFLARSELWLNIQVAEFQQDPARPGAQGRYTFFVVDKHGRRLKDSHFTRHSLVRAVEAMNRMLMQFNLSYIRREWLQRVDRNQRTIYHSRPDPEDFLHDLNSIRQLAQLKGFDTRLSHLVERGLLNGKSYYLLKKVEAFVERYKRAIREIVEQAPQPEQIELCREYFENRRQALQVMMPLFQRLLAAPSVRPSLSDAQRLHALCRPFDPSRFALDEHDRLYITGPVWLGEPNLVLDPLLLMARTDCYLREETQDSIEAALESLTEYYIAEHREEFGRKFLLLIDESIRQANTATVLRNLRAVGLLQRFVPRFAQVQGLIHVVEDHSYTVDEHTFVLIEVFGGIRLLGEVFPDPEQLAMVADYQRIRDALGLKNYANKYARELRMLGEVTELRSNPMVRAFFYYMDEVRENSVEYLVDVNLLEHGYTTCMLALNEIAKARRQLDGLVRMMAGLPFAESRVLVLAGLFHDICKPAQDHPAQGAQALAQILAATGLSLPEREVERIRWLVANHLAVRPLLARSAEQGEEAVREYARSAGDVALVRMLVLFTYADRVAVHLDPNKNSHDALVLTDILRILESRPGAAG
jgi:UTP:GlnB (protein PII) uridylyltransferase